MYANVPICVRKFTNFMCVFWTVPTDSTATKFERRRSLWKRVWLMVARPAWLDSGHLPSNMVLVRNRTVSSLLAIINPFFDYSHQYLDMWIYYLSGCSTSWWTPLLASCHGSVVGAEMRLWSDGPGVTTAHLFLLLFQPPRRWSQTPSSPSTHLLLCSTDQFILAACNSVLP